MITGLDWSYNLNSSYKLGGRGVMKGTLRTLLIGVFVVAAISTSFGQDHLLITEFAVSPTAGEFVEIYNPTSNAIDLTNYYLTDATFGGDGTYYYRVVEGGGGGGTFGDFNARFPAGAMIGPGEYQTIALNGSDNFMAQYGVAPTYELFEDGVSDAIPDMLEAVAGSINGQGGLSDAGEVVVLYYWDGASDLVMDVDYVVWGDKAEAVDKSGVSIDGPDADSDSSTYLDDMAIEDQTIVDTENDGDDEPHDFGRSAQRKLSVEDEEEWTGGNGITGHNEIGENTSWKGGIWSYNGVATPNARALGPETNIADIQFVRSAEIGPDANDDSPSVGDTLSVIGVATTEMRGEIFVGARWGGFMQDPYGGPWSGIFIVQHDSTVSSTNLGSVLPGDTIRVTGVIEEFPTAANLPSFTQFAFLLDPVTPVEFVGFGNNTVADTIDLTPADLGLRPGILSADPQKAERWEGVLARFSNLTVTGNGGLINNIMTAEDENGETIALDDYFDEVAQAISDNGNAWPGFPPGTKINVTGYIRGASTDGSMTVNPRTLADVEVASIPPELSNIQRTPVVPTSAEAVEISVTAKEADVGVANVTLHYSVEGGAYTSVAMVTSDSVYSGSIPAQADGAKVDYFLSSVDNEGDSTSAPADTSVGTFFYFVRNAGPKISDVQFTPFASGTSSFVGLEVTVTGIATTDSSHFAFYWLQDGTDPWSGILINDLGTNVKIGDEVQVTGTVSEFFTRTEIGAVSDFSILSSGNLVPEPLEMMTGDITTGSPLAEQYEGMLVRVRNAVVTTEFPDTGNFGEFEIDDGSGAIRVDDAGNFRGQLDSAYVEGDSIESLTGILDYTFGDYKIEPRNDNDVVRIITAVDETPAAPLTYQLHQNYPNPFNPETAISYSLAKNSTVTLTVFNVMGQKIRTLIDTEQPAGRYTARWNGLNNRGLKVASGVYFYRIQAGDFSRIHKMLLLK